MIILGFVLLFFGTISIETRLISSFAVICLDIYLGQQKVNSLATYTSTRKDLEKLENFLKTSKEEAKTQNNSKIQIKNREEVLDTTDIINSYASKQKDKEEG